MKVLSLVFHIKLWPRLKFFSTDDDNEEDAEIMTIVLWTFVTYIQRTKNLSISTKGKRREMVHLACKDDFTYFHILFKSY